MTKNTKTTVATEIAAAAQAINVAASATANAAAAVAATGQATTATSGTWKKQNEKTALKAFTLVQQFDTAYWWWSKEPQRPSEEDWDINDAGHIYETRCRIRAELLSALASARAGDIAPLTEWVVARLVGCDVLDAHGIIHGDDQEIVWDKLEGKNVSRRKEPHAHILVRFVESSVYNVNRTQKHIAEAIGVMQGAVKRPLKGRYSIDNMFAYLIHIKEVNKKEYSPTSVYSLLCSKGGETYLSIYQQQYQTWLDGRAMKIKKKAEIKLETITSAILRGDMTEEQILETPELLEVYARHRKKIEDALELYGKKCSQKAKKGLESNEFRTVVYYIYGQGRSGKSHLATEFAKRLAMEDKSAPWKIMMLGGEHPVDNYRGEEILVGNDLEPNAMSKAEWKRLLDNAIAEKQSARYNDCVVAARVIILSSTVEPAEFFRKFAEQGEDFNQFLGRIGVVVAVANAQINAPQLTTFKIGCRDTVDTYLLFGKIPCNYKFAFSKDEFLCEETIGKMMEVFGLYALPSSAFELPALPFPIDEGIVAGGCETTSVEEDIPF